MENKPFSDRSNQPTEESLQVALGLVFQYYHDLLELCSDFKTKWGFYKGWSLKVFDKKKALLYIIPLQNIMQVNLTIREKEKEAFLLNNELDYLHTKIKDAEKFAEGFVLRFTVDNEASYTNLRTFIKKLINQRQ